MLKPDRHRGHKQSPRDVIIASLHFDAQQIEAYDKLIEQHRLDIRQADDSLYQIKETLYTQLSNIDTLQRDSLIQAYNHIQKNIEYIHWYHFKAIEMLCRPNQKADFERMQGQMAHLFSHPKHPPRPE
ncbi:MAG: hypothetical protein FGM54_01415 [Chitinophagaceae bacterium]|nr:hypothetical protein [Chitinophagaceae bacterium]